MDILVLTSTYPSLIGKGRRLRVPEFVERLSAQIAGHYKVTVIAPSPRRRVSNVSELGLREEFFPFFPFGRNSLIGEGGILERVRENRFLILQVPFLVIAHFFFSAFELVGKKRIIIHAHWLVYCGIVGWVLKKTLFWKDIRLIVTIHGSDRFFFRAPILGYICGRVLRSCHAVTCVNAEVTDSLKYHFRVKGRTLPMGVPASLFDAPSECVRVPNRVLFVGRVVVSKGIDRLLSALLVLNREFHLVVVGDGPYLASVRARVKLIGLESRVTFLGWVNEAGVKRAMAAASCLVLPSESEGFSVTVLEAMASGLPVVGNKIPALSAQLGDGCGYLVDVFDAFALANAIEQAARRDPEVINRAMQYADQFRWECVGEGYRFLFEDVSK